MMFKNIAITTLALVASTNAFVPSGPAFARTVALNADSNVDPAYEAAVQAELDSVFSYEAGKADTEFAKRFGHLAGKQIRTVGEAFAEFTEELGFTVNPLYKNMVTDIVGTTHLIVVNARFVRDPIWCLGILTSLDLLLKNYPEVDIRAKIYSAFFKSMGMSEDDVRSEAQKITDWAQGKTKEDVENALKGEGEGPVQDITNKMRGDEWWMYSRYFGLGLVKMMDLVGIEMDKDEVYPIMEDWMTNKVGRSHFTACSDSDLYFKVKDKLDMMETMMKEIEIREKKRMAERLEEKAERALKQAELEAELKAELEADEKQTKEAAEANM